jgi:hypothetical protein
MWGFSGKNTADGSTAQCALRHELAEIPITAAATIIAALLGDSTITSSN